MAIERLLTGSIRDHVSEFIQTEDLVLESMRDMVKDELKQYIRAKIDEDSELKAEIKETVKYYFNAKARSLYAELKASQTAARLGISLLPEDLRDEASGALVSLFERELGEVLERVI
jgi:non-homologous end joining protein Ku